MAVILLDISRLFATKVPGKIIRTIDSGVFHLTLLALVCAPANCVTMSVQTCLVGSGADGKHNALEAVTVVLDLPPPQPLQMVGGRATDRADPKSAIALQRLVQAAVCFCPLQAGLGLNLGV
jgi:hypothetical protein